MTTVKRTLLAFTGAAGAGKDTAAQAVAKAIGPASTVLHFSDPLYQASRAVQEALDLPVEKDRLLLQVLGTEWGRAKDPDFWVKIFESRFAKISRTLPGMSLIVADVRFPNEVAALRRLGFRIIRVVRPALKLNDAFRTHISEHALDDIEVDAIIGNEAPSLEDTARLSPIERQASLEAFERLCTLLL